MCLIPERTCGCQGESLKGNDSPCKVCLCWERPVVGYKCMYGHVLVLWLFLDVTIPFFPAPRIGHTVHVTSTLGIFYLEYILLHAPEIKRRLSQLSFLLIPQVHKLHLALQTLQEQLARNCLKDQKANIRFPCWGATSELAQASIASEPPRGWGLNGREPSCMICWSHSSPRLLRWIRISKFLKVP